MLHEGRALCRVESGWIRQNPQLAERLRPIEGVLSKSDIMKAKRSWEATCDSAHRHTLARISDLMHWVLRRVAIVPYAG